MPTVNAANGQLNGSGDRLAAVGGRHRPQGGGNAPLKATKPSARFHPADGVALLDLGCSKTMTIASVSVMMMITITTPRGVTIGSGFRMASGGAT